MFAFDGQFKSRPIVSLGGASKKEERSALIQRTQEERQKRELHRKTIVSAIKIQAFIRAEHVRHHQYQVQRAEFDSVMLAQQRAKINVQDLHTITLLTRKLLFFYSSTKDIQRLIWLCQLILKHHSSLAPTKGDPRYSTWLFQSRRLLILCCRSLDTSMQASSPIAVQLRMLEVFTSPGAHQDPKDAMDFTVFLIQNGYFRYLRSLINLRVPSSIEPSSTPPTPLAGALADLVLRPVNIVCHAEHEGLSSQQRTQQRHEVLAAFATDLLSPEMSEQIMYFLLPMLSDPRTQFPFNQLVESLLQILRLAGTIQGHGLAASPWLLYATLVLAESHLGTLSPSGLLYYVQVLQYLLPWLPSLVPDDYDDDNDDSDSDMEVMVVQDEKLNLLRERCLEILDSKDHVKSLWSLITASVKKDVSPEHREEVRELVPALCCVAHHLMMECRLPVQKTRLLYTLALNTLFIRQLWAQILDTTVTTGTGKAMPLIQMIFRGQSMTVLEAAQIVPMLSVFCALFSHLLFSIHDQEFYGDDRLLRNSVMPFTLHELIPMTCALRDVVIGVTEIIYPDSSHAAFRDHYIHAMKSVGARSAVMPADDFYPQRKWIHLLREVTHLVKQLHSRDTRRQFCPDSHWLSSKLHIDPNQMRIDGFFEEEGSPEGAVPLGMSSATARNMSILQHIPFVLPFKDRVKLLQRIISTDRLEAQGDLHSFMMGQCIDVTIQRKYLYQDAFDNLNENAAPNLKRRVRVRLINEQGLEEAGVDGGGLFREFLNELLKAGFDQKIGFFNATHERLLYPNPQARLCAPNYLKHFRFLGRMLGKSAESVILPLLACQLDMSSHLLSLGVSSGIVSEVDLILNRAGKLVATDEQKISMTICSKHRRNLTTDWPGRKSATCSYPTHRGARRSIKNVRRVNAIISAEIYEFHNAEIPIGSAICSTCRGEHYKIRENKAGQQAIYENMLVELPFASFFLCKLLGKHGTDVDIHNLESLDPEVYKNLLFLKTYQGNVEDLALNFTAVNNDFGENQVVELLPGGKDVPVTASNRITYIHLVADYKLNKQIRAQCVAFRTGLASVINLDWLRMFDHNEIQVLISGAPVPVDLEDLKRNTNYSGGYNNEHPCIQSFWRVVEQFNDTQKRQLLKFVTSCSRPPLLGFKDLYPAFCVHSAGKEDRLPTASTCMNLLKLPEFSTDGMMKERLLYAVESGAGFELS